MFCVERMQHRANSRKQFGRHLGDFELVKSKLAEAAADTFAMQSATYHTAALIDSGAGDCMVEAAMLKVFASDQLWRIINDTMQVWGGKGFFTDEPFERMMRDARLNQIAEGANDVLRCFIAMVGMRGLGEELKSVLKKPWQTARMLRLAPSVPTQHFRLRRHAASLAKQIGRFARAAQRALIQHREGILDQQFIQARIGDMATELFMASCVYSRLDSLLSTTHHDEEQRDRELATGELYMKLAELRNRERLAQLKLNSDTQMVSVANSWLVAATLPVAGEA